MYYLLIGDSKETIDGSEPPTLRQILQNFLHYHCDSGEFKTKKQCAALVVKNAMVLWKKLKIDTRRTDTIEDNIIKEYDNWHHLCKYKDSNSSEQKRLRSEFTAQVDEIFDVTKQRPKRSWSKSLESEKNVSKSKKRRTEPEMGKKSEDLSPSRTRSSMTKPTSSTEPRKDLSRSQTRSMGEPSSSTAGQTEFSDSNLSSDYDNDKMDADYKKYYKREKKKVEFITGHVVATIDAVGLSDTPAARILTSVAQALGHDLQDLNVSRTTIQRRRAENRKLIAETIIKGYKVKH